MRPSMNLCLHLYHLISLFKTTMEVIFIFILQVGKLKLSEVNSSKITMCTCQSHSEIQIGLTLGQRLLCFTVWSV